MTLPQSRIAQTSDLRIAINKGVYKTNRSVRRSHFTCFGGVGSRGGSGTRGEWGGKWREGNRMSSK